MTVAQATVGIAGLGLIGGSLARSLRHLAAPPRVLGWSAEASEMDRALEDGAIHDMAAGVAELAERSTIIVLATPVGVTLELMDAHAAALARAAVVTDVGSVKKPVVDRAAAVGLADRFVGAHPMAGGHGSGYGASRIGLFEGARVWLCGPASGAPRDRVARLWARVGADPEDIDASAHDELVAWSSHLPQLAATALGDVLATAEVAVGAMGPGGRDSTRLAASPGALWADILSHNATALVRPLEELMESLRALRADVARGDRAAIEARFERARRWREER